MIALGGWDELASIATTIETMSEAPDKQFFHALWRGVKSVQGWARMLCARGRSSRRICRCSGGRDPALSAPGAGRDGEWALDDVVLLMQPSSTAQLPLPPSTFQTQMMPHATMSPLARRLPHIDEMALSSTPALHDDEL